MNMSSVLILFQKILKKEEEEALSRENVRVTALANYNKNLSERIVGDYDYILLYNARIDPEINLKDKGGYAYPVADDGPETTSTPVANFREQMAYLKEAGLNVILLPELLR